MPVGRKIWQTFSSWKRFGDEKEIADMTNKSSGLPDMTQADDWSADAQNLLAATLSATPAQRLAWLEEALHLAYASGALKPKALAAKGDWEAVSSGLGS